MVSLGKDPEGKLCGCSGDQAWNHSERASAIAELLGNPLLRQLVGVPMMIMILKGPGLGEGPSGSGGFGCQHGRWRPWAASGYDTAAPLSPPWPGGK